jgi:uncharacterized protein (DUF2461 family)
MGFRGWPAEAIEFYEGLEADNSKTYWNENKSVYDNCVLRPMTELAATLELGGYIQLSVAGLAAGGGMWMMAPDQLERYRKAVLVETTGQSLAELLAALRAAGMQAGGHDELKTAPKGYPKDHPRIELLRYKGVTAWQQWPPGPWLGKPSAKDRVVKFFRTSAPLNDWLEANVGPSTLEHWGRH